MSLYWLSHALVLQNASTGINWVKHTWDLLVQFLVSAHESMIISIKIKTKNADVRPWENHSASSATGAGPCWSWSLSGGKDEGRPQNAKDRSVNQGSARSGDRKEGAAVPGSSLDTGNQHYHSSRNNWHEHLAKWGKKANTPGCSHSICKLASPATKIGDNEITWQLSLEKLACAP